jgi:3,4-dihydroxy 2-butanone 4-phosphate synthase/GTP cyclohydrolase II
MIGLGDHHDLHDGNALLAALAGVDQRVGAAVDAIARGRVAVVTGLRHDEFQGGLVAAAQAIDAPTVNFLLRHGRGPLYVALDAPRLDALDLELVRPRTAGPGRPAVRVPVDVADGTTSGISAADRAATIRALVDEERGAADFRVPGHVHPIAARASGVLERAGHTEAAADLVRLAGGPPAAVVSLILNDDGATASAGEVRTFALEHGLAVLDIADVVAYRRAHEDVIVRGGETLLPIVAGTFRAFGYRDPFEPGEQFALVHAEARDGVAPLIRIHLECMLGDVFRSGGCDCAAALDASIDAVTRAGHGAILYLRSPDGDAGRLRHLTGEPRVADLRQQLAIDGVALSILRDLGLAGVARPAPVEAGQR